MLYSGRSGLTPPKQEVYWETQQPGTSVNSYLTKRHVQAQEKLTRLKGEKLIKEKRECTHRPAINRVSQGLCGKSRGKGAALQKDVSELQVTA